MEKSKQVDFIKLTTEGYPVELKHPINDFYEIFQSFVNMSEENNFFAELTDEGVAMHAGMRTEVCKLHYDTDRVIITSKINESGESSTGEFTADEEFSILGHACLGVLYFCDLYALGTGQQAKFVGTKNEDKDKEIDNNTKYTAWPV